MAGTAKSIEMCGKTLTLGDRVVVRYTTGERFKGSRLSGFISELWSPKTGSNVLQARVGKTSVDKNGWCFHDDDCIEEHTPVAQQSETNN